VNLYYSINTFLTHLQTSLLITPTILLHFAAALQDTHFATNDSSGNSMLLPEDFIEELRHAGLYDEEQMGGATTFVRSNRYNLFR